MVILEVDQGGTLKMDQRTRKAMLMHKALHPRDGVHILYVSRKEGGRGLSSIENSVDSSIQQLEDYMEKHGIRLITGTRNNNDNTKIKSTTLNRKLK